MTAPELSAQERETIARFEAAADAPESFDATAAVRRVMAEVRTWPNADFWHTNAIHAAINGTPS